MFIIVYFYNGRGTQSQCDVISYINAARSGVKYKKSELMLTRRAKAYSSSGSIV